MTKAVETIAFKPSLSLKHMSFSYGFALLFLMFITFLLFKKHSFNKPKQSQCQIIEKKHLSHKTIIYIIHYKNQPFLLADNQQSIALHPISLKEQL